MHGPDDVRPPLPLVAPPAARLLCSWCDEDATYHLLADLDSRDNVHAGCDEHERQWGRLYRRSVSVVHHPVLERRTVDGRTAEARGLR